MAVNGHAWPPFTAAAVSAQAYRHGMILSCRDKGIMISEVFSSRPRWITF